MHDIEKSKIDQLNSIHGEILTAMKATVHKAIEAGQILQEIKESLPHGEFTGWVEENTSFDIRTAQRYMKAHKNRDRLKNDTVSSLRQLTSEEPSEKLGEAQEAGIEYLRHLKQFGAKSLWAKDVEELNKEAKPLIDAYEKGPMTTEEIEQWMQESRALGDKAARAISRAKQSGALDEYLNGVDTEEE